MSRARSAPGAAGGAEDFAALLRRVRACAACADLPFGPRPVLQLHPDASLLIVGQAPGRRVHASGIPFDDPSGVRLRAWLGLDEATFYDERRVAILPMAFCYPGAAKSGDAPPRPECAATWRATLLGRLRRVRLTLVIGQYAQAYHLGRTAGSVTEAVRGWRAWWPDVVPLPHPSPRNQSWLKRNPWFEADLLPPLRARVAELLREPARTRTA